MTREEALRLARKVAAAVCDLDGCSDDYSLFVREGRMDNEREVKTALAAIGFTVEYLARQRRKSNVVDMVA